MHHPKEAIIDGVKFVLIPEDTLELAVTVSRERISTQQFSAKEMLLNNRLRESNPELFK
jgi:hypothetical protein